MALKSRTKLCDAPHVRFRLDKASPQRRLLIFYMLKSNVVIVVSVQLSFIDQMF